MRFARIDETQTHDRNGEKEDWGFGKPRSVQKIVETKKINNCISKPQDKGNREFDLSYILRIANPVHAANHDWKRKKKNSDGEEAKGSVLQIVNGWKKSSE